MLMQSVLFRGDRSPVLGEEEQRVNEMLLTGVRDDFPIPPDEYVPLLRNHASREPEIAQNIARVVAGCGKALLDCLDGKESTQFAYVEGSPWKWGTKERTGARTQEAIHYGVVPCEIGARIPAPLVEAYSSRTYDELLRVFQHASDAYATGVRVVTHEYHAQRSLLIAREVQQKEAIRIRKEADTTTVPSWAQSPAIGVDAVSVITPAHVAEELRQNRGRLEIPTGSIDFLIDVIRAGEPSDAFKNAQYRKEMILSAMMRVRQWTGLDPEQWILDGMKMLKMR